MERKKLLAPIVMMLFLASMVAVVVPVQASSPNTFTVSPSGGDDTANIQGAFDAAVAAGPGSIVKLTGGHFYSSNILVENFRGIFEGAGEDATVVDTLRGLDPRLPGLVHSVGDDGFVFFFGFKDGDITIRDMSFDITARRPGEPWVYPFAFEPYRLTCIDIIRIMGNVNSQVERVRFVGHEGTYRDGGTSYNVESALVIHGIKGYYPETGVMGGPILGSHIVSGCSFEHVDCGVRIGYLENGKARIAETTFAETIMPVFLWDFVRSTAEVSYNQMRIQTRFGILCWQGCLAYNIGWDSYPGPLPADSLFLIHHNTIHVTGDAEAIELWDLACPSVVTDPPGGKSLDAIVYDNDISLETTWGGICGWPARDVKVINNRITGTGLAGIYVGGIYDGASTGWVIRGNNFEGLMPVIADIWLSSATSHCTVVARKGTTVLDEGIDNIIIGAYQG